MKRRPPGISPDAWKILQRLIEGGDADDPAFLLRVAGRLVDDVIALRGYGDWWRAKAEPFNAKARKAGRMAHIERHHAAGVKDWNVIAGRMLAEAPELMTEADGTATKAGSLKRWFYRNRKPPRGHRAGE